MLLVDFAIHVVGEDIMFDADLKAHVLKVQQGDQFEAHVDQQGRVYLRKVAKDTK